MKRSSVIQRTFFRRPSVRSLVPDLKLLLVVAKVECESHVGVWVPTGLADNCGLAPEAVDGGFADLVRRGFLEIDRETGEIFLTDFFRENSFRGDARQKQARGDFRQIASGRLREAVLAAVSASPECELRADFLKNQEVSAQAKAKGQAEAETSPFRPPCPHLEDAEVDLVVGQLAVENEKSDGKPRGPKWRAAVRARIRSKGPTADDLRALNAAEAIRNADRRALSNVVESAHSAALRDPTATKIGESLWREIATNKKKRKESDVKCIPC